MLKEDKINDFILINSNSINLNFIIYIKNLYLYNNKSSYKFPKLPLNENIFLNISEFENQCRFLWKNIFDSISSASDVNKTDFFFWTKNKFPFLNLFQLNDISNDSYNNIIKKSFESWYWGTGNYMCNSFSDKILKSYYNEILYLASCEKIQLRDTFYLQMIYDEPLKNWQYKTEKMLIISPNNLASPKEIFDIIT